MHLRILSGIAFAVALANLCPEANAAETAPNAQQWLGSPMQWKVDGDAIRTKGAIADSAVLRSAPLSARVSVEADVEIQKSVGKSWKIAGVGIVQDTWNFWQLAIILPPADQPQQPMCELAEMRDAQWLAQSNLKQVVAESTGEALQIGRRYRLRIAMDPQGVEGSIANEKGQVIDRRRFAFSAKAVTSGRPALRCGGLESRFSSFAVKCSDPVAAPPTKPFPAYQSKSFVREVSGKKTGFFHTEQQGDTWWVIDPMGRGFVPLGVDHVSYNAHWCEKLGYAPYHRKNEAKFGGIEPWCQETLGRLRDWNFNLLGAGHSPELQHRGLAHTAFIAFGTEVADMGEATAIVPDGHIPCSAFPNVFHPDFEAFCRYRAEQACRPHRNDPWLFGYFLDNELKWWGEGDLDTGLFETVMGRSPDHTAKLALRDFLAERHGNDIARFNKAWGTQLDSFDALLKVTHLSGENGKAVLADKKAFVALIGERYFSAITRAIRSVDPNHMILGCRFAGGVASKGVWQAAGNHCDIVTFNYYGNVDLKNGIARNDNTPRRGKSLATVFEEFYAMGRRPMMVTEWSFPALDAGLPSIHGAGQRFHTQAERTKATEITLRTMLSLPYLVGHDYFMWVDEPALGISKIFPEDSNYGLINEDGKPYELLTAMFTRIQGDAGRLRREGPSKAGVPIELPPNDEFSPLADFVTKHTPPTDSSKPNSSFRFDRKENSFVATNGSLELRGKIGGASLADEVLHRGLLLGRLNGMLQQPTGWLDLNRLVSVKAAIGADWMTLDLVGRYDVSPGDKHQPFELTYRLTFLPDRDWFVMQLLECRNTSNSPLNVKRLYFRPYAQDVSKPTEEAVPRLWGDVDGGVWFSEKADSYWGLAVDHTSPLKIIFYLNTAGGQHPDAEWTVDEVVAPGAVLRPATPIAAVCLAGRGGPKAWSEQAKKAIDSLAMPEKNQVK